MKTSNIKAKVAAKIAKGNAKIAAKCGGKKAKACAAVAALGLAAALAGCGTVTPSRSQSLALKDCTINIYGSGNGATNDVPRVDIASQAMQVENSGSETQTATPQYTTDVKPDVDLNYNDALSAGASAAGSGANAAASLATAAAKAASSACEGGACKD